MMRKSSTDNTGTKHFPWWIAGLCAGILFFVLGALDGQFTDIYRKAVMICLECIGIG